MITAEQLTAMIEAYRDNGDFENADYGEQELAGLETIEAMIPENVEDGTADNWIKDENGRFACEMHLCPYKQQHIDFAKNGGWAERRNRS